MGNTIQAIRGMNDVLPTQIFYWQFIEKTLRETLRNFSFQEIRVPILEKTELFKRSIGDATDIVEKEMYTFLDRNEESLTLRPEGTASCVRAGIEHGLFYHQVQKWWYSGPYFRYERPQKGRYRQFHQCGAEMFGLSTPDSDAELILLSATIFEKLGLKPYIHLQLNSLGTPQSRQHYRTVLVEYLKDHYEQLDEDSKRRLTSNPLRILDSKNPAMLSITQQAPKLLDYLDEESLNHFQKLQHYLSEFGIEFTVNPCLVRGLDYYSKTVFEWVTTQLGAQGTVCAGGRFDGLVEQLGGSPTPALGFAIGLERSVLLLETLHATEKTNLIDVYLITGNEECFLRGTGIAQRLRKRFPNINLYQHCGEASLKNQIKKADKSGSSIALIIGEEELNQQKISVKFLRESKPQALVPQTEIEDFLSSYL